MNRSRVLTVLLATTAVLSMGLTPATGATPTRAHTFRNCTDMHHTYPHGVGKPGAHDKTSGTPVTNFKRSTAIYNANKKSDRDGDNIACEAG